MSYSEWTDVDLQDAVATRIFGWTLEDVPEEGDPLFTRPGWVDAFGNHVAWWTDDSSVDDGDLVFRPTGRADYGFVEMIAETLRARGATVTSPYQELDADGEPLDDATATVVFGSATSTVTHTIPGRALCEAAMEVADQAPALWAV